MKKQLVTVFFATSVLAACGQSSPPTYSANSATSTQVARLRSYCEQNRAECWFGAQNQSRVAQERAQRGGPELSMASREPAPTGRSTGIPQAAECDDFTPGRSRVNAAACPLTAARTAILSRPASDTHRVLLAERQRDRGPALNFGNPRPEPQFKWFAQYFANNGRTLAADPGPTATQLSMDTRREDAAGYRLRFLDGASGAER